MNSNNIELKFPDALKITKFQYENGVVRFFAKEIAPGAIEECMNTITLTTECKLNCSAVNYMWIAIVATLLIIITVLVKTKR